MSSKSSMKAYFNAKYDTTLEQAVLNWVADILEEPDLFTDITGIDAVHKKLKSGTIICRLMNKLQPGSIEKFTTNPKMPFQEMENIGFFNEAMREYGVKPEYIFVTTDLYEKQNMGQVLIGLRDLSTQAKGKGVKPVLVL